MTRACWHALLLPLLILPAGGLLACGGGGSTSASTTTVASTTPTTTPSPTATATTTPTPKAHSQPSSPSSGGSGGGAASFRVAHGDNSIPEFGSEAPASERQRATAALAAYLRARAAGDWATVCTYLTGPTRRQLEGLTRPPKGRFKGCGPVLGAISTEPAAARATTLTSVAAFRVKGANAFILFYGPHASKYIIPMVREGSAWKVSQLAPLAYPLGAPSAGG
jgi:hypothetical protein